MKKLFSPLWLYLAGLSLLVVALVGWQQRPQDRASAKPRGGGRGYTTPADKRRAAQRVRDFRNTANNRVKYPNSFYLNRRALDSLISQPGCEGVRVYLAVDKTLTTPAKDSLQLVLVGTNERQDDLVDLNTMAPSATPTANMMLATYDRCPSNCDYTSVLR